MLSHIRVKHFALRNSLLQPKTNVHSLLWSPPIDSWNSESVWNFFYLIDEFSIFSLCKKLFVIWIRACISTQRCVVRIDFPKNDFPKKSFDEWMTRKIHRANHCTRKERKLCKRLHFCHQNFGDKNFVTNKILAYKSKSFQCHEFSSNWLHLVSIWWRTKFYPMV